MSALASRLTSLVPWRVRQLLRSLHRGYVFNRAMQRLLAAPAASVREGRLLSDLIYGWGNEAWSAREEYLTACIEQAQVTPGPILECGSGLSTIVAGAVGRSRGGIRHCALEHNPEWAAKVQKYLDRYTLNSVELFVAPLRDYGEFEWYDPPLERLPAQFSLVICDGPPGRVRGGRYGLVPVTRDRLAPGCVILLDDAARAGENANAKRWESELNASVSIHGQMKPYIQMKLPGAAPTGLH